MATQRPMDLPVPPDYGQVGVHGPLVISRMNRTQVSIWHLGAGTPADHAVGNRLHRDHRRPLHARLRRGRASRRTGTPDCARPLRPGPLPCPFSPRDRSSTSPARLSRSPPTWCHDHGPGLRRDIRSRRPAFGRPGRPTARRRGGVPAGVCTGNGGFVTRHQSSSGGVSRILARIVGAPQAGSYHREPSQSNTHQECMSW